MFTPVIYGEIQLSWKYLFAVALFFPVFYYLFEFIDVKVLPKSKIIQNVEETEEELEQEQKIFEGKG